MDAGSASRSAIIEPIEPMIRRRGNTARKLRRMTEADSKPLASKSVSDGEIRSSKSLTY
jgi:hypothetical protein